MIGLRSYENTNELMFDRTSLNIKFIIEFKVFIN